MQLRDLGVHRLKDLSHSEHIFRLIVDDLPDVATPPDTAEELRPGERAHFDAELLPAECPYRGLLAFREEDAPFFFGRESFTERLADAVQRRRWSRSSVHPGSGKSSVVFAGLVPTAAPMKRKVGTESSWTRRSRCGRAAGPSMRWPKCSFHCSKAELSETDRLVEISKLASAWRRRQLDSRACYA